MKKRFFLLCTAIIVILNLLLITIFNHGEEKFSCFFIIIVAAFLTIGMQQNDSNWKQRQLKPERWAILTILAISIIRFINRIDSTRISDTGNLVFFLLFVGAGVLFLVIAILRMKENEKKLKGEYIFKGKNMKKFIAVIVIVIAVLSFYEAGTNLGEFIYTIKH